MNHIIFLTLSLLTFSLTKCSPAIVNPTRGEIVEAVYGLGTVAADEIYLARFSVPVAINEFYIKEGQDVLKNQKLFLTDQGTVFYSPISGRVTDIAFHLKENIPPQATVLTITNLQNLYLSVALEQQAAMRIKEGLKVEISFEFFRNTKLIGIIKSFYPKNNEFIARVSLESVPTSLMPGMTADVVIEVDRKQNAILVPTSAISNGHIVIMRNKKKERVPVKLGLVDLERAELIEPVLNVEDGIVMP